MINTESNQREISWFRARFGSVTGSEVYKLMTNPRKKDEPWSETAKTYIYQIAAERLFNPQFLSDDDIFQSYLDQVAVSTRAMEWGVQQEESARQLYSSLNDDVEVFEVSSCAHDIIPHFAASPDGIVRGEEQKCLEIKCPSLAVHTRYAAEIHDAASLKAVKPEYYWQVMAEMSCTGCTSADFVSYCAWLSSPIHIVRIERNDDDIRLLEERVRLANDYIAKTFNV
uniref:lambda exonuclease family protein n=1 Tax=Prevotella sp. TaxID=59823 RepID=UPI004027E84B